MQSANARSTRNNTGPVRAARSRRTARNSKSKSSGTLALVRCPTISDKAAMVAAYFGKLSRWTLDFALPPRCAGCGMIVADVHSFCPYCWKDVGFLGESGCATCGMPLEGTEQRTCGACLARE